MMNMELVILFKILKDKGYIKEDGNGSNNFIMTAKSEIAIRKQSLEEIFSKLKKGNRVIIIHHIPDLEMNQHLKEEIINLVMPWIKLI